MSKVQQNIIIQQNTIPNEKIKTPILNTPKPVPNYYVNKPH